MDYSLFDKNHKYIDKKDNFFIKKGFCPYSHDYETVPSREDGNPGLIFYQNDKKITIHSSYYPSKDALKRVEKFEAKNENIVCFGLGLGYHLKSICEKYPERKIIIIEPDKNLFNLFLGFNDISSFNKTVTFIIGYADHEINKILDLEIDSFDIFRLKQLQVIFGNYYNMIEKRLKKNPVYSFKSEWKYKKFDTESTKILFIDSSYVLTKECLNAIKKTGNEYKYLHIDKESIDYEQFIKGFLKIVADFRPDFVLTINHLGFDAEGRLTELLTEMELPFASWYVDSPKVVLSNFSNNVSDFCNLFVWDRDYMEDMYDAGYKHVSYLPLATMTDLFKPMKTKKDIGLFFVGSSMNYAVHKNTRSFIYRNDLLKMLEMTAKEFLKQNSRKVEKTIQKLISKGWHYNFEDVDQKEDFKAAVIWRATQIYRLSGLKKLAPFYPRIHGDPNWDRFLDNRFRIGREILYYDDMPGYYNRAEIVFNMTSRQMKYAVNQRVFDVPACGSFLLTDFKEQLAEIFDIKKEIVCFKEVEEIPELVKFYLRNPLKRKKIAQLAGKKVRENENYQNRLIKMIKIMKKNYKNFL